MKTLLIIFALCLSIPAFAQKKALTEQQVIDKTHIDFTKEEIRFVLHGEIEIGGHTFINDTCKSPIEYRSNLDRVVIIDPSNGQQYTHRICDHKGCKVIHLVEDVVLTDYPYYRNPFYVQTPGYGVTTPIKLDSLIITK